MGWELELIATRGFLLYSGRTGLCEDAVRGDVFFVLKTETKQRFFMDCRGAFWIVNCWTSYKVTSCLLQTWGISEWVRLHYHISFSYFLRENLGKQNMHWWGSLLFPQLIMKAHSEKVTTATWKLLRNSQVGAKFGEICFFRWNFEKNHPWKVTWNLKIIPLKRKITFQTSIFGFHVNFPGCSLFQHSSN